MTRPPRVSGKDLVRALQSGGFELTHSRGSHHYLRSPYRRGLVVVPVHGNRTPPVGTLRSILR
ncbi:MAG TPA: type II toxin-antitoxin system HicA family toxin [Dehalococcoidia bacterium]|nr:type II toxin-antitoxin system HicA family toxin [Dehalococcoidia bacterium]